MKQAIRVAIAGLSVIAAAGCAAEPLPDAHDGVIDIVTTTPVLADVARNVAAGHARVTSLIPSGADPHTFEPTLRSIRNVANADLGLSTNLFLEQNSLTRTLDTTLPNPDNHIRLAEASAANGIHLIPLVEDISLDTIWLGLKVAGPPHATSTDTVTVRLVDADGPGEMSAFITGTFGTPEVVFSTLPHTRGAAVQLPVGAHTHLNWLFSAPGVYRVTIAAGHPGSGDEVRTTVRFAVAVDPTTAGSGLTALHDGHHDLTIDMGRREAVVTGDTDGHNTRYAPDEIVVVVPATALDIVPADPRYRAVGHPGHKAYVLRQAVIGKHIHGTIDPHVWQDATNVAALARTIRDQLVNRDPGNAADYIAATDSYIAQLAEADRYLKSAVAAIPDNRRYLVTTHDAYGYLGKAYGLTIAGFVSPNPSVEPSPRDIMALGDALDNLHIPAVFVEKNTTAYSADLLRAAEARDIAVCPLYGDTFDDTVTTYLQMVRANADSLRRCLAPDTEKTTS